MVHQQQLLQSHKITTTTTTTTISSLSQNLSFSLNLISLILWVCVSWV
jgi:hypothetical protein